MSDLLVILNSLTIPHYIIRLFNIFLPLTAALSAILLVAFSRLFEKKESQKGVNSLLGYFVCAFIIWLSLIFYFFFPKVFLYLNWLFLLSMLLIQIFFYRFICSIAHYNNDKKFSKHHYLAPVLFTLAFIFIMLITPVKDQLQTIKDQGTYTGGSILFHYVSNSKFLIKISFNVIYITLSTIHLHRYKKQIQKTSLVDKREILRWTNIYIIISLSFLTNPILGLVIPKSVVLSSFAFSIQSIVMLVQYIFLGFHLIKYPLNPVVKWEAEQKQTEERSIATTQMPNAIDKRVLVKQMLNRNLFEAYLNSEKPYLNPSSKLIEVATGLNTNRNYLSLFINTEYGINFSQLMNRYRLIEFNRLKKQPEYQFLKDADLATMAGFGSYKSFKRSQNNL